MYLDSDVNCFLYTLPLLSLVSSLFRTFQANSTGGPESLTELIWKCPSLLSSLPMGAAEIKAALNAALGTNAKPYWRIFSNFLSGRAARAEFEDSVRQYLNTPHLGESDTPVSDSETKFATY